MKTLTVTVPNAHPLQRAPLVPGWMPFFVARIGSRRTTWTYKEDA